VSALRLIDRRWRRGSLGALLASVAFAILPFVAVAASADGTAASWRLEPALAPPPPPGVAPAPYPVPVGRVGEISFWAPNRGLLITGGGGPVSAGLYAYNGVSWHQLATVCGGPRGRIAWAGPDEFWTISDQRAGQLLPPQNEGDLQSVSLCHFLDGQVVGSYAMPLEEPDSYLPMDAAACYGPNDCWFGGELGPVPDSGAFHLHWNGSTVTAVYGTEGHAVTGMVNFAGQLFEGVQIRASDVFPPPLPSGKEPVIPVIHKIAPDEATQPFSNVVVDEDEDPFEPLPEYGKGMPPYSLEGFTLASDGSPLGSGATQLWAAADASAHVESITVLHGVSRNPASPTQLTWFQLAPKLDGAPLERRIARGTTLAPEPGSESAWMSLATGEGGAEVARLEASGEVKEEVPGAQEQVGSHGAAGAIACPAPSDCWMATEGNGPASSVSTKPGWLFHFTDGSQYPLDTDPNFAGVISYRPPDAGVPVISPPGAPEDDSLINQIQLVAPSEASQEGPPSAPAKRRNGKPLLSHVKSRFLHHRVLVISFALTARAHVQLLGRRGSKVVARTRDESLSRGRHQLSLALNPAAWPTKLQVKATPAEVPAASGEGTSGSNSSGTSTGF
jgi:hypothetical protein